MSSYVMGFVCIYIKLYMWSPWVLYLCVSNYTRNVLRKYMQISLMIYRCSWLAGHLSLAAPRPAVQEQRRTAAPSFLFHALQRDLFLLSRLVRLGIPGLHKQTLKVTEEFWVFFPKWRNPSLIFVRKVSSDTSKHLSLECGHYECLFGFLSHWDERLQVTPFSTWVCECGHHEHFLAPP